jgi:hypothetical protein
VPRHVPACRRAPRPGGLSDRHDGPRPAHNARRSMERHPSPVRLRPPAPCALLTSMPKSHDGCWLRLTARLSLPPGRTRGCERRQKPLRALNPHTGRIVVTDTPFPPSGISSASSMRTARATCLTRSASGWWLRCTQPSAGLRWTSKCSAKQHGPHGQA